MQVSFNGGRLAFWSRDGRELFYDQNGTLMSVELELTGEGIDLGAPQPLFSTRNLAPNDISRDGSRFLAVKRPEMEPIREIRLVLNWSASLDESLDDLRSN